MTDVPDWLQERHTEQANLRANSEREYVWREIDEVYDRWVHPDLVMLRLWAYPCSAEISSRWDQWMRTSITCAHGVYQGVSNGVANPIGLSLGRAFARFQRADHGACTDRAHREANEDNYTDHCVVCRQEVLHW